MSAGAPPYEDGPQSMAPDTSADNEQSQRAPTANGNSLKDAVVNSEVSELAVDRSSVLPAAAD